MRAIAVALLLFAIACTRTAEAPPPPPPDPLAAERMAAVERSLAQSGIPVTQVEQLRSLREFPNCPEAQMRYRVHFGETPRFVNVSRFRTAEEAEACYQDFKEVALRAGPTGWERLGPTISTNGAWLYLFPQDLNDGALRKRVVQALQQVK